MRDLRRGDEELLCGQFFSQLTMMPIISGSVECDPSWMTIGSSCKAVNQYESFRRNLPCGEYDARSVVVGSGMNVLNALSPFCEPQAHRQFRDRLSKTPPG